MLSIGGRRDFRKFASERYDRLQEMDVLVVKAVGKANIYGVGLLRL